MMMYRHTINTLSIILIALTMMTSCQKKLQETPSCCPDPTWENCLAEKLPYLGHRNWIVIADMAYPLQCSNGITTIYADEPYLKVLEKVKTMVDKAPHVFAHIYHDKELEYLTEEEAPGVTDLRQGMTRICGNETQSILHAELLKRMDEAGKLYQVIVIKTPLTTAYSSTFLELDCAYWTAEKQARLDKAMEE